MESPRSPDGLTLAAAHRVVEIEGEQYRIRAPTLFEGVQVLSSLESVMAGNPEDLDMLRESVLLPWLGPDFMDATEILTISGFIKLLRHLLFVGAPAPKEEDDEKRETQEGDPWADALALYCQVYGGEPWAIFNTVPFAFFLQMMSRADRSSARASLRAVEVALLPQSGKDGTRMLRSMQDRAGWGKAREKASKKDLEKDRAALRRLFASGGQPE